MVNIATTQRWSPGGKGVRKTELIAKYKQVVGQNVPRILSWKIFFLTLDLSMNG